MKVSLMEKYATEGNYNVEILQEHKSNKAGSWRSFVYVL